MDAPRILVIDDNQTLHADIRRLLTPWRDGGSRLASLEAELFGPPAARELDATPYRVDCALQGDEGLARVRAALEEGDPYAVALVDVRMPPGWDGIETIERIWPECPDLQVVVCTAYADYPWTAILRRLGASDNLLVLKKPFDPIELVQMTNALARKWSLSREDRARLAAKNEELGQANTLLAQKSALLEKNLERLQEAQEELLQTAKMAAVGQLAAGLAHELNNPLSVIVGFAQGLASRVREGDPERLPVASILREAQRCQRLISELLSFSRKGGKRLPIDLGSLVRGAVVLLEARARKQGVEIRLELDPAPMVLEVNPTQIEQVLVNLANNAIDAMPKGGVLVLGTRRDGDGAAHLEVADTGEGIPPEVRSRIFEPFFTTKPPGQGTGLGLSVAYQLVLQHQGSVSVHSEPGQGTRMTVRLPGTAPVESEAGRS